MKMKKVKKLELERLAEHVVDSIAKAIRTIDMTLAQCEASNSRMAELSTWMREKGDMTNGEKTQEKRTKKLRPIGLAKGKVSRGQDFNKPLKLSVRDRDVLKRAVEYYIGTET